MGILEPMPSQGRRVNGGHQGLGEACRGLVFNKEKVLGMDRGDGFTTM